MRNKILLAMTAAGMLCGTTVFAAAPPPAASTFGSGQVTFTGTITEAPCNIAPGDEDITVPFGQISLRTLKANNATSASKAFTIRLQDCAFEPASGGTGGLQMSKVTVSFSGQADASNIAYTGTGNAANVGVQLLKGDNTTLIAPNTEMADADAQQLSNGSNELNFFARLINTGGADSVTPGTINTAVTYKLKYL